MRVLVTGATGVIGRRVVPLLVGAGHEVTAHARTPERAARLERAGARAFPGDLLDPATARRAVAGHDAIVNLATHLPSSSTKMFMPGAWRENDRVRRELSAALADAALAAGVGRLVQESFAPIYESAGSAWIDERSPVRPARYNRSVLDAERSAARVTLGGGAGVVLRFALFYGPDAYHVHDMVRMVRKGFAPLFGDPAAYMSSVTHDDAAAAVVAALGVPAGVYNVADDEPVSRREFADALARTLGVAPPTLPPRWAARLAGSLGEMLSRSLRISNRKLREASSWRPRYPSVREGWPAVVAEMEGRAGGTSGEAAAVGRQPSATR